MNYLKEMSDNGYSVATTGKFHRTMLPYVFSTLKISYDSEIIEVGAAQGHCAISLWTAGFRNIKIVDIDTYNFNYFKETYGFACFQCDVSRKDLPFPSHSIGTVLNAHLIEHLSTPSHFLTESFRVLQHGGVFVLITPDWRKQYKIFYRDPTHVHPYDKESIARLLKMAGFSRVRVYSWGSGYGLGRLQAYRIYPRLGMIGRDILAVGVKE